MALARGEPCECCMPIYPQAGLRSLCRALLARSSTVNSGMLGPSELVVRTREKCARLHFMYAAGGEPPAQPRIFRLVQNVRSLLVRYSSFQSQITWDSVVAFRGLAVFTRKTDLVLVGR